MNNYTEYVAYFETVARNHKLIKHTDSEKHFYRVNIYDLENSLQSVGNFPGLALEKPMWKQVGDGYANQRWALHGAVMVLDLFADPQDVAGQDLALEKCRQICDDIRAKMIKDRKLYDAGKLDYTIPGLDHSSFVIELFPEPVNGQLWGARLSWTMNTPSERFDVSKWDNEQDYQI